MNQWITICEFPLGRDLSPLAEFIRRHELPVRISEENNAQVVASLVPQLVEPLRDLFIRWQEGSVDLARIEVQVHDSSEAQGETDKVNGSGDVDGAAAQPVAEARAEKTERAESAEPVSAIPQWPLQQTPVSLLLIALCFIGWFLLRQGWAEPLVIYPEQQGDFDLPGSILSQQLSQGEFWRLWTPAMVHFSIPHALFNSLGIWIVGRSLEARAGSLWFALLVLISAPLANIAQYAWSPGNLFGGMSGVVYALIGAALVIQRWQPQWRDVPAALIWLAVVWLLVCMTGLVDYFIPGGIANAAHAGGFAAGLLLGILFCLGGGAQRYFATPAQSQSPQSNTSRKSF
ncbi:rhomboid family intramembrane serine protease [Microbulbifer agarilyticus]|uniref:rhomboid family intramembrane serine protease n=1 Tax=Microbulbifer agarilyticus TaxID=260552 RepID=UPI001CD5E96B|nr:rhomboid family intramembrane serine protease [Microbulbifer agarilyticus]MCA0899653.1 rhomboid family intramembrane serine protease [Microbulbifer agarilyticus]